MLTLRNQIESPLLRLPGELRNRICELAVGGNIIVVRSCYKRPGKISVHLTSADTPGPVTSVSGIFTMGLACRQLHQEIALTQYTKNIFHFDGVQAFRTFVEGLTTAQRALLTSVSINVEDYLGPKLYWDLFTNVWKGHEGTKIFLPELERVYINAPDRQLSLLVHVEVVLHILWEKLKIGTERKEGISLMAFDVFRGMENRDQAKTIKLSWGGEAFV
ncbi:hypothetical protein J4E93_006243 [Alternaria ventricosa]|uniref:uncharacterized protein n=1 Tax=Alternaria ventricosa TaxID=1187951 RepID=UPI0020C1C79E|nr:uncharacterized protein J4E93_006243 [Alternaria ventricosa]KAI4644342.1 hypothetical protein J4E93_006243 [Alternaria ventricosa]